ncbi:type IV secretory system conjugative DNA transfer family protein [Nocardia neocaledoniensis]|uniref:type IV secretory system conjugative DNA transfer family protein n=1 Tax=Nocardia neocaledoniensis TaxID=236511 RepID=UPI0024552BB1|nr:TraM recognition domain-containing protein [Nocardia neocaledoniensis]
MFSPRETRRRTKSGLGEEASMLVILLALLALVFVLWAALKLGSWQVGQPLSWNPFAALLSVVAGDKRWPWQATPIAVVLLCVTGAGAVRGFRSFTSGGEVDAAARTMQPPGKIRIARAADNLADNQRLLNDAPRAVQANPGPLLGRTVIGDIALHVPAELGVTVTAGQRTGKTVAWAIPAVLSAWGPCLATSNKPDLYRHTVYGREQVGRVWVCDLQAVTGQVVCGFWVNLFNQVTGLPAARKLAGFFVSGSAGSANEIANAKADAYFDGGAQELFALHIFAAACAGGDLHHVAEWLGRDQDPTPALILRHYGHDRPAARIIECQGLYARQRDGLYDMARRFLNVLSDSGYAQMVTPPVRKLLQVSETAAKPTTTGAPSRGRKAASIRNGVLLESTEQSRRHFLPEFDPTAFVTSNDTLYPLSMTGPDGATPLTAALVGQVLEAALTAARARPDGRLAVPLLCVLDEAANCARISELPSYYTYAAGCGIILMTILQVLEQGENLWGVNGLKTMMAQSIEVYGGSIASRDYLEHWSAMAGQHDVSDRSRTYTPSGIQRSLSWRAEPILDVAMLSALPKDRALVRLPGHGPVVVRKVTWFDSEYAPLVRMSMRRFEGERVSLIKAAPPAGEGQS